MSTRQLLPDPWIPNYAYQAVTNVTGVSAPASGALNSSANRGVAVPVIIPSDVTLYELFFVATNGTGNYDLGLYRDDYSRIASAGSTAMTAAGKKSLSLPNLRFRAGTVLIAALTLSSTTGTILRGSFAAANRLDVVGVTNMASSLPLPDPWVGAAPSEFTIPIFGFGVR